MSTNRPSSAPGIETPGAKSESAPNHPHHRDRPHTPDEAEGTTLPEANRPPTPESFFSDSPPPRTETASDAPPVELRQKTWAKPQTLGRDKVRMNVPQGIPETHTATTSRWPGVFGKLSGVYNYTRIPREQVRLLLLKPGSFDEDIYVSIITVNDAQLSDRRFPYCALSYHWGDGPFDNTVFVQEEATSHPLRTFEDVVNTKRPKKIKVKPNLWEALKRLRDENIIVSLWVDAICINQFDEDEKTEQVMKMALIYSQAYNVNIWLGSDNLDKDTPVSDLAMSFIPMVNNPNIHGKLLREETYVKSWASLFELLKWSWFSRKWVIQELALAQSATVHCGKHVCLWSEFQTAISIFDLHFDILKPKLIHYFENVHPDRWNWDDDSMFRIKHLGAKLLVDMTATLFRKRYDGSRESTKGLETLVCTLSGFDTSDPRDTINALRNISKEVNRPNSSTALEVPVPDYGKDLFEVYRDFVKWVVATSQSLDILCRFWALKERKSCSPTTPRLVELPSWILFVEDSAWGKGDDAFNGRQAGDSFVGLPDDRTYNASGQGSTQKRPTVYFSEARLPYEDFVPSASTPSPIIIHDMSILVRGVAIGTVSYHTEPFPDGIITRECLVRLGWTADRTATTIPDVPDRLWQTLVADRDPDGKPTPTWYKSACQSVLAYQSNNGHINIDRILRLSNKTGQSKIVQAYLKRVKGVTWNRSFIEASNSQGQDRLVGFGPPKTEHGDIIVIMFGCSVPVILRPTYNTLGDVDEYQFIGEAYIYGKMDGEALEEDHQEHDFKLI